MPRIVIVGEAFGAQEEIAGKPFVGPSGRLLNACLARAGINRSECLVTNVFMQRPPDNDVLHFFTTASDPEACKDLPRYRRKYLKQSFLPELQRLDAEIAEARPNLILALGGTALWALTGFDKITEHRGAVLQTRQGPKAIATYHPAAVLRQRDLLPIFGYDLRNAALEAQSPDFPDFRFTVLTEPASFDELCETFLQTFRPDEPLACDIETGAGQITEIGFANAETAIVIPFVAPGRPENSYWPDVKTEAAVWRFIRQIFRRHPIIGQNFQYDLWYIWGRVGIPVPRYTFDTMLAANVLQPELPKDLGSLATFFVPGLPSWKHLGAAYRKRSSTE